MTDTTSPSSDSLPTGVTPLVSPPSAGTAAPADRDSIERVEELLSTTELAVARAEEEVAWTESFTLSVLIPVFNERSTIEEIVRRVQAVGLRTQLVIVDDHSTDGTRDVLEKLAHKPDVHVFFHETNRGKGASLRTALAHAQGDLVVIQDADLEYDPNDYLRLVEPIVKGDADVVYGSRYLGNSRQDPSFLHRLGNGLLTELSNRITGQRLTDMETCYKVFRREIICDLTLRQDRFGFEPEITAKLARRGYRILEVPIQYNGRSYGDGKKIGWKDGVSALFCILRYGIAD